MVGPPVTFSLSKNYIRSPPPILGEHTREILQSLNYKDSDIEALFKASIVQ